MNRKTATLTDKSYQFLECGKKTIELAAIDTEIWYEKKAFMSIDGIRSSYFYMYK